MGKFCMNCGKELDDNIRFCSGCGAEVSGSGDVSNNSTAPNNQGANNYQNSYNGQNAFNNSNNYNVQNGFNNPNNYNAQMPYNNAFNPNTPESLLRTLSERYKINGIIWIVLGILQGLGSLLLLPEGLFVLIVGILNIISAVQDLNYSKNVLMQPQGIVNKVKPLAMPIVVTVYNLIFGGLIGIAGSIYYLVGIRNFVMTNANAFMALEQQPQRTF